jgi:hypothetical protein
MKWSLVLKLLKDYMAWSLFEIIGNLVLRKLCDPPLKMASF